MNVEEQARMWIERLEAHKQRIENQKQEILERINWIQEQLDILKAMQ